MDTAVTSSQRRRFLRPPDRRPDFLLRGLGFWGKMEGSANGSTRVCGVSPRSCWEQQLNCPCSRDISFAARYGFSRVSCC